jgi:hypothetical protein
MNVQKLLWAGVLASGMGILATAQNASPPPSQQSDQGVKSDAKNAAHATGRAAKKTGRKVKRGTKKATHKAAQKTRQGAQKVEDKTATPPQR